MVPLRRVLRPARLRRHRHRPRRQDPHDRPMQRPRLVLDSEWATTGRGWCTAANKRPAVGKLAQLLAPQPPRVVPAGALGGVPARRPSTGAGPDDEVGTVAEHQLLVRVQSSSIKLPRRLRRRVGLQAVAMKPITAAASRRAGQCCVRLRDPCCTWLIGRTHRSRKQESESSTSPANHCGLTCSTSSTRIMPDILLWFPRASPG
jgi:hypothetical protein